MLKSELIKYLQENVKDYGDGEVQVEVSADLNFMGKIYPIYDVVHAIDVDLIMCVIEAKEKPATKK